MEGGAADAQVSSVRRPGEETLSPAAAQPGPGSSQARVPSQPAALSHPLPGCPAWLPCRLEGLDLQSLSFTTLLVDPPRAGLDSQTVQLLKDFQSVVYISCNPGATT